MNLMLLNGWPGASGSSAGARGGGHQQHGNGVRSAWMWLASSYCLRSSLLVPLGGAGEAPVSNLGQDSVGSRVRRWLS